MKLKYSIFFMVAILLLAGCNKDEVVSEPDVSENVVTETGQEEVNDTVVSENESNISLIYVEHYLEEEGEIVDFLKEYFMISCKEDLEVLTQLPLSESFFNSCVNGFEYLDEADETEFVYVVAWLETEEDVFECLVQVCDQAPGPFYVESGLCDYSVKITLAENQIDQVSVEKIGWTGENHTEETDRREYTQEEQEAAWESRLGDYGILLTVLPEVKSCEEVFEISDVLGEQNYNLTIHSIWMEEPEYAFINAGITELVEEERMYWDALNMDRTAELIVCRLDGRVISIKNSEYHDILNAVTFDMATGEKLACADIFADVNTADAVIAEKLVAELQMADVGTQMIRNAESFSLESVEGYHWYLDGEGVVITVGGEYKHYSIVLPYREYAYLFQPQYLPGNGIAYYRSDCMW